MDRYTYVNKYYFKMLSQLPLPFCLVLLINFVLLQFKKKSNGG